MSPYICQTIMSPVMQKVRKDSNNKVRAHIYYDDMIILGQNIKDVQQAADNLRRELVNLGMLINKEKSDVVPQTEIEWLGMRLITD